MPEGLKFAVSLEDAMSPSAKKAAKGLKDLQLELKSSEKEILNLQRIQATFKKAGFNLGAKEAGFDLKELQLKQKGLKMEMKDLQGETKKTGDRIFKVVEPAEVLKGALEGLSGGFRTMLGALKSGDAKGIIEGTTEAMAGLAQVLDLVVPGLGQVAAAVIKVGGAFAGMTVGIIQAGVEMSLEVAEVNERLTATFDALGRQGPESGAKTMKMLDEMSRVLPITRNQLAEWTKQYEVLGISDLGELRAQILATASAEAIMPKEGARAYEKLQEKVKDALDMKKPVLLDKKTLGQLYDAGVNLDDLRSKLGKVGVSTKALTVDAQKFSNAITEAVIARGKKPLEAMGNEIGVLKAKGMEVLNRLFDGIDTKPITDAIKSVLSIGDQGDTAGRNLHRGIKSGMNMVIKAVASGITEMEVMFLRVENWVMALELKFRPLAHTLERLGVLSSGEPEAKKAPPEDTTAHTAGQAATNTLGETAKGAMLGMGVGGPVGGAIVGAFEFLGHSIGNALDLGMNQEIDKVKASGARLGLAAIQGGREATKSHSPSLVAFELGTNVSQGFALGMGASMDLPEKSSAKMGGNAISGLQNALPSNDNARGKTSGGFHVDRLNIEITAPNGVTDATALSVTGLSLAFERMQLAAGR